MRLLGIAPDAEIHIERVGAGSPELEQNIPEREAVSPPDTATRIRYSFPEHCFRLRRPHHLIVDEAVEAAFTEGRIFRAGGRSLLWFYIWCNSCRSRLR